MSGPRGKSHAPRRPAGARAVLLSDSGLLVGFIREHKPERSHVGHHHDRRESLPCLAPHGVVRALSVVADEAVLPTSDAFA